MKIFIYTCLLLFVSITLGCSVGLPILAGGQNEFMPQSDFIKSTSQFNEIKVSDEVRLQKINGRIYEGEFLGFFHLDRETYTQNYNDYKIKHTELLLPEMNEGIKLNIKNGPTVNIFFKGFNYREMLFSSRNDTAIKLMEIPRIASIISEGVNLDQDDLMNLFSFSVPTATVIALKQNENNVVIPLSGIQTIEKINQPKNVKNFLVLGIFIDVVAAFLLYAAAMSAVGNGMGY